MTKKILASFLTFTEVAMAQANGSYITTLHVTPDSQGRGCSSGWVYVDINATLSAVTYKVDCEGDPLLVLAEAHTGYPMRALPSAGRIEYCGDRSWGDYKCYQPVPEKNANYVKSLALLATSQGTSCPKSCHVEFRWQ